MTTMTETKVYQSKWGFHPCDLETYKKLRKLNQWFLKAQIKAAEWNRWARKDEHNRVIKKFVRNDQGQRIGCEIVCPKPEPTVDSPFLLTERSENQWKLYGGERTKQTYWECGTTSSYFFPTGLFVNSFGIDVDYHNAKKPVAEDAVTPLKNSVKEINDLYEKVFGK
ncbi:MAG: hypothetical protein HOG49_40085 [Candidatus Scalindua sp.]|nr:hypothetical protein [Candidatus Scalindua sp.]